MVTVEENTKAGKTTLLQKCEESLSSADKFKIRVEHEPISEFQSGNWKKYKPTGSFFEDQVSELCSACIQKETGKIKKLIIQVKLFWWTEGWTFATYLPLLMRKDILILAFYI